jgi:uncharacterized protein YjbJ (UPF0337 family)
VPRSRKKGITDAAGKIARDVKLEAEGKPIVAGKVQNATGE